MARAFAAFALLALVAVAGRAGAHADLVSAEPRPFSELTSAPAQLVLQFSEPLEDRYTGVDVLDRNGTDHVRTARIDAATRTSMTVLLEPLADGIYTVRWRTLSVDTHTNTGQYLLAVNAWLRGEVANATLDGGGAYQRSSASPVESGIRTLAFLGATLAAGIPLFLVMTADLVLPARRRAWLDRTAVAGAVVAALGALGLAWSIGQRIEAPLSAVFTTSSGAWVGWRIALHGLAAAAFAAALTRAAARWRSQLVGAGASLSIAAHLATSRSGHAAALGTGSSFPVLADWLHLVAVSFWVAGIVAIALVLWGREEAVEAPRVVQRFSPLAVAAVVTIVVTGTYASLLHLEAWSDLTSSAYGWALLAKVVLVLPLVALGAYNRYIVLPRLDTGVAGRALSRLRRSVASEATLMAMVLVAAGVLTANAPPAAVPEAGGPATDGGDGGLTGVVHRFNESGYSFAFAVHPSPPTVGIQHIVVEVQPPEDGFPENVAVVMNLRAPSGGSGEGEATVLERVETTTRWEASGPHFTEAGAWRVQLALQGKGTFVSDRFEVTVAPPP